MSCRGDNAVLLLERPPQLPPVTSVPAAWPFDIVCVLEVLPAPFGREEFALKASPFASVGGEG